MPDENFDEQSCRQRIASGNEEAARKLLRHYHPFVLKLVRAHLPRRMSEEDLTQMIFIKIFQNLETFSGKVPLEHWISRVAVNTCLNELRAEKRRPEFRLADFDAEAAAAIENLSRVEPNEAAPNDARAARDLLEKMLAHLPPNDRLILNLLHLEEKSVREIQQLTGWSQSAIKVRAFRARHRLKKLLQRNEQAREIIFAA